MIKNVIIFFSVIFLVSVTSSFAYKIQPIQPSKKHDATLPSSSASNNFVIGRDDWYEDITNTYTDLLRTFNLNDGCPAEEFYLDCNYCTCIDAAQRLAECSLLPCPETPQIVDWENGKWCPANRPFYFKCNDCQCASNGQLAECTSRVCSNPYDV